MSDERETDQNEGLYRRQLHAHQRQRQQDGAHKQTGDNCKQYPLLFISYHFVKQFLAITSLLLLIAS